MEKKFSRQKSGWYLLFIYPQLAFYTPRVTGERRGSEQNKNDVNLVNPNRYIYTIVLCWIQVTSYSSFIRFSRLHYYTGNYCQGRDLGQRSRQFILSGEMFAGFDNQITL